MIEPFMNIEIDTAGLINPPLAVLVRKITSASAAPITKGLPPLAKMTRMKKNYNPFKMWGSYVGLLIIILTAFNYKGTFGDLIINISSNFINWKDLFPNFPNAFNIALVSGFLIGWGIHSLFRRYK